MFWKGISFSFGKRIRLFLVINEKDVPEFSDPTFAFNLAFLTDLTLEYAKLEASGSKADYYSDV